jgi:hypothetical protein
MEDRPLIGRMSDYRTILSRSKWKIALSLGEGRIGNIVLRLFKNIDSPTIKLCSLDQQKKIENHRPV